MARKIADEGPGIGHNMADRSAAIRAAFDGVYKIESEIASLHEQHIAPLSKARTKKWRTLKKDLNIPRKLFIAEYNVYKLARLAQEGGEEEGGAEALDNLREVFSALHPGGQLDWVAALQTRE